MVQRAAYNTVHDSTMSIACQQLYSFRKKEIPVFFKRCLQTKGFLFRNTAQNYENIMNGLYYIEKKSVLIKYIWKIQKKQVKLQYFSVYSNAILFLFTHTNYLL